MVGVENRLGDGVFGTGLDLPFESADLFFHIHRSGIHADADREGGRFADGVIAEIEAVVEFVDHVGQADGVDVENGGRVRIRTHFWRIAGDEQQIVQAQRCGSEQIGHHTEQVPVAAAVVQNRLDPDLAFDQYGSCLCGHSSLRPRAVGDIYTIDTGIFQQSDGVESLRGVASLWRQNLDRGDKFTTGDLSRPA